MMHLKIQRIIQFLVLGPLLVTLVIIADFELGALVDDLLGFPKMLSLLVSLVLGSVLLVAGLYVVAVSGLTLLRRGRGVPYGDVVRSLQTSRLVTDGVYGFSRNPMILGYALILSSVGLYLGSITGTVLLPIFALLLLSCWIKLVEEGRLERRFGEEYRRYRQRVPFLLPVRQRKRE